MSLSGRPTLRVLFVEDNPGDARLIGVLLEEVSHLGPVRLFHVPCLGDALTRLQHPDQFDVVLLDLSLPDSSGFPTLARIQKAAPEVAVVVCTGYDDADFALEAVHSGAQDYLVKGQGDGLLIYRSLFYAVERKRLEHELVLAKQAAEEANHRKSRFLASMSHELRTPLNAILGFSEMIKEQMLGPVGVAKYAEYAADIFSAGTHLLALINDVLDLSKVEAGRFHLIEESIDLAPMLASCLDMVGDSAKARGIVLQPSPCGDWPKLRGDSRLVRQILLNLLSNALKFTPGGGIIGITVQVGLEGMSVTVSDTGCGIPPEAKDKVMEEFEQADITIARQHGGTGLGLPLSRRFMALHGGTLTLSSQVGQGTSVTMRFPTDRLV